MALEEEGRSTETFDELLDPMIKIHVDFLEEELHTSYRVGHLQTDGNLGEYYYPPGDVEWEKFRFHHRHTPETCKCRLPLYHIGQDEAVFKQNALPAY